MRFEKNIVAIPTTVNGLNFRSRLEASWFVFFNKLGYSPLYEPESFQLTSPVHTQEHKLHAVYIPDFQIQSYIYVEIKPILYEYQGHDDKSIAMACVLGYSTPTIIVLGSPFKYYAVMVNDRHKGNPHGTVISFSANRIIEHSEWDCYSAYPDEFSFSMGGADIRRNGCCEGYEYIEPSGYLKQLACESWNKTQWKGR